MSITAESLQRLFEEQVGRPIAPEIAEAAAGLAASLVDRLNSIDMEPMLLIEPNLAFEAGYREADEEGER